MGWQSRPEKQEAYYGHGKSASILRSELMTSAPISDSNLIQTMFPSRVESLPTFGHCRKVKGRI